MRSQGRQSPDQEDRFEELGVVRADGPAQADLLARLGDGWHAVAVELDADLIDFADGYVITSARELLRLYADGSHELLARFDRHPRALQVLGYEAPVVTVVGEQGMVARVAIE